MVRISQFCLVAYIKEIWLCRACNLLNKREVEYQRSA